MSHRMSGFCGIAPRAQLYRAPVRTRFQEASGHTINTRKSHEITVPATKSSLTDEWGLRSGPSAPCPLQKTLCGVLFQLDPDRCTPVFHALRIGCRERETGGMRSRNQDHPESALSQHARERAAAF